MGKKGKWTKIGNALLLIFFLLVIIDRILVYFELQSLLHYIGYVFGLLKGLIAKMFYL